MPSKTLLRTFILIQIPLMIVLMVALYLFFSHAPASIRFIIRAKDRYRPGATPIEAVTFIALLVANIGVFFFWRGMRALYLIVVIASVLESVYLGPFANSGPSDFLENVMNAVSGIILGLIFFSPARELFERPAFAATAMGPPFQMPPPDSSVPMPWSAPPPAAPEPAPPVVPPVPEPVPACVRCGAPSTGTKFCEECGAPIEVIDRCPACGADLRPGKKFCGACGLRTQ